MARETFLQLAALGLKMPVGTDLVLHEHGDRSGILVDGKRLGQVVAEAANRYRTPLAFPLMDLTVEKSAIAGMLGVPPADADTFHFQSPPGEPERLLVLDGVCGEPTPRMKANADAIRYIVEETKLIPVGMSIGPFSMMTKLFSDPISPIFLAGSGETGADDPEIAGIEVALELCEMVIRWSLQLQAKAGMSAVFVCEPAANIAYFSPNQLEAGSDVFERYVMEPNRRIRAQLDELGVDLIFHDCGELLPSMVEAFGAMRPCVLSLGSSRTLWEDAALVPKDVVLYGNLPTKRFYSDELTPLESVERMARELVAKMEEAGHPFILGSECDVLSVEGCENTIRNKVNAFLNLPAGV